MAKMNLTERTELNTQAGVQDFSHRIGGEIR